MGGGAVFWLWLLCGDCIGVTESLLVDGWLVGQVIFRIASDVWLSTCCWRVEV